MTAVLNALRCGVTVAELLNRLPGAHPSDLQDAYHTLDRRRRSAVHAWYRIVRAPQARPRAEDLAAAATLLPAPLQRISTRVRLTRRDWDGDAVLAADREVAAHVWIARQVESALAARTPPDRQAVELGIRLHHPWDSALWSSAFYLPRRVTDLSSARVADLLHERSPQR